MLTKDQAVNAQEFHHVRESQGKGKECYRVRRNGATQTWKTRPTEWRIPVIWGHRGYQQIYQYDAADWYVSDQCPRDAERMANHA